MSKGNTIVKAGMFIGIAGLIFGLYTFYKRQLYYVMQYCYKLYKFVPKKFSKDNFQFDLTLKILNRSTFMLQINSYNIDIFIQNKYLTSINRNDINIINPSGVSYINATINIVPKNILDPALLAQLLGYYITDKSKIIISVKGTLNVQSSFIKLKKLPIDYSDSLQNLLTPSADPNDKMICPKNF